MAEKTGIKIVFADDSEFSGNYVELASLLNQKVAAKELIQVRKAKAI